mgnify:CR=1 FL=1
MRKSGGLGLFCLVLVLLCAGCGSSPTPPVDSTAAGRVISPADALAAMTVPHGWIEAGTLQDYTVDDLYDLVNGQADAFFAYGFHGVAVRDYADSTGTGLRIEVWQLSTPADAFGLYSTFRAGAERAVGNEGDADPGRRLDIWQDRFFVRLFAPQPIDDAELTAFGQAVAAILPQGGEPPALIERLAKDGLLERSTIFFREEISIQSLLWLGGQNLLGLDSETGGVLASYETEAGVARLLLVEYQDGASAMAAKKELRGGEVDSLVAVEVEGNLLAAVFGTVEEADAQALLAKTLGDDQE